MGTTQHITSRYEESAAINATAEAVFARIDDPHRPSSHMDTPSVMMGGGSMSTKLDAGAGQRLGSVKRLEGSAFGMTIFVEERVVRYEPPRAKSWETVGEPRLVIMGAYRMDIDIEPKGTQSVLTISIAYAMPRRHAWLGKLFGRMYARWCVRQMIKDAA